MMEKSNAGYAVVVAAMMAGLGSGCSDESASDSSGTSGADVESGSDSSAGSDSSTGSDSSGSSGFTTGDRSVQCIEPSEAYPISSSLVPGPTSSAFYRTVTATEYADIERTHVHPADFYDGESDTEVTVRRFDGMHESAYNIVTRERNEAFLYGTDPSPYVVKFDVDGGGQSWRTELPTIEENFNWVGLVAVHGNGDLYAVHARTMVRIDSASGDILARADLPPPSTSLPEDTVYNGFTIAPNGFIVGKSYGRPPGCTENGSSAIATCVDDDNPQPPSAVVTLDPETLELRSFVELPSVATGRPAISQFDGRIYVYLNGADEVFRVLLDEEQLVLDEGWRYEGFLTEGQTGSSSVVVMGDWVAFQTNGTPARAPMSIHVVSQADAAVATSLQPYTSAEMTSSTPSSVTADPASMSVYSQDGGRGQIVRLDFNEDDIELEMRWIVDQRTINHLALIGPPEHRVLVSTDAPDVLRGIATDTRYTEQVVWRDAGTGEELVRSGPFPPMFVGGPVNPGFDGSMFYLGLDGGIRQLSTTGQVPVCAPS